MENKQLQSELHAYIESGKIFKEPYVFELAEKSIKLGFTLEVIKETLCRFLLQPTESDASGRQEALSFSRLIDDEKFIEHLIINSNNIKNAAVSGGGNSAGFLLPNDYDELEETDDDAMSNFNDLETEFKGYDDPNDYENINDINSQYLAKKRLKEKLVAKKPLTPQQVIQQEQEFINQSIKRLTDKSNLRPIIIDSNDVALSSHSNKQTFLITRIKQVIDYFEKRNHQIYVILSLWRKEQIMTTTSNPSLNSQQSQQQQQQQQLQQFSQQIYQPQTPDQLLLYEMEQKNQIHYTPSKRVGSKRIVCDDDSYMLKLAVHKKAIIVSNDNFKRFLNHNDEFKLVIEERVLMYSFIDDTFMPAEDPLGKNGPSLDNFLRFESFTNQQFLKRCPYRKKCTYGHKCKFWHPERGMQQGSQLFKTAHQSVLDDAQEQKLRLEIIINKNTDPSYPSNSFSSLIKLPNTTNLMNKFSISPASFRDGPNGSSGDLDEDEFKTQSLRLKQLQAHASFIEQENLIYLPKHLQNVKKCSMADKLMGLEKPQINELKAMGPDQISTKNKSPNPLIKPSSLTNLLIKQDSLKPSMDVNTTSFHSHSSNMYANSLWGSSNESSTHFENMISEASTFADLKSMNEPSETLIGSDLSAQFKHMKTSQSDSVSNSLKTQLAPHLEQNLIKDVLQKYPNETDVEKLIFLARGICFSSTDF